ncbi:hypothetical protein ILUMI_25606 [Ignelater luminosus]|uniref:Uncharacterized protein n=1 Tax=Ignelater luminosus TaxID=2038154 RepID=A0A8K0C590_IGNLU|nr:hypothetical protein ILUMI_25606 [Ignelater luminosus]
MNKRFKGSGELSDDNSGSENLLAKLTSKELKSIKVTVPRHDVLEPTSSTVMQRTLEDPNSLIIHRRGMSDN